MVLALTDAAIAQGAEPATTTDGPVPPNVIVVNVDGMGYGDLGAYGHPAIQTPQLDRLAREGQRWTNFYAAASVCTPCRAGLLTGRLPVRSGTAEGVVFPYSAGGLPQSEVTIAEMLKTVGYETAFVGRWHLGHRPEHLPTTQSFDRYYGIPYSNEMNGVRPYAEIMNAPPDWRNFDVPIMRGTREVERPADQRTLTRRYTGEAVRFVEQADALFFLYLAHNLPHAPLFASADF